MAVSAGLERRLGSAHYISAGDAPLPRHSYLFGSREGWADALNLAPEGPE